MAKDVIVKKYLTPFIDRLVPSFLSERYPNYKLFVKLFLKYLEEGDVNDPSGDGLYTKISEILRFTDIESIANETNEELKEALINEKYKALVGSVNARYLSDLIDDILFLKHQKTINEYMGTKATFQFVFLFLMGGFVTINNIDNTTKIHDGTYLYNGLINYDNTPGFNPYVYEVNSPSFTYSQIKDVLEFLNPAGMQPIVRNTFTIHGSYLEDTTNTTISTIPINDFYVAMYDEGTDEFIAMIKPFNVQYAKISSETSADKTLGDGTTIEVGDTLGELAGMATHILAEINISDLTFSGEIHRIKFLQDPTPGDVYYSKTLTDQGTVLIDMLLDETGEPITIENNLKIQIFFSFNQFVIGNMVIGSTFIVADTP